MNAILRQRKLQRKRKKSRRRAQVHEPKAAIVPWLQDSVPPHLKQYRLGACRILVGKEPVHGKLQWHLSISCQHRNPSWEEIKAARYALCPDQARMAMLLPPQNEYVNMHEHCFHLWEVPPEAFPP